MKSFFNKTNKQLPRMGQSITERFGSEFLAASQPDRALILHNIATEKGTTLCVGYDYECVFVIRNNIVSTEINAIRGALRASKAEFIMNYHRTHQYPILELIIDIPEISVSSLPIKHYFDITDPDFQDFVTHLPESFEFAVFWYTGDTIEYLFMETTGIVGDSFLEQVEKGYAQAKKDYWAIPENNRDFIAAKKSIVNLP